MAERPATPPRGRSPPSGACRPKLVEDFLSELWTFLADEAKLLAPTVLRGFRDRALPGTSGAYQIDADRLLLLAQAGLWRCERCRRAQTRPAPHDRCLAWRCDGTLALRGRGPGQLRPAAPRRRATHAPAPRALGPGAGRGARAAGALVQGRLRAVNTLVCTPTLELGVDIGALDAVLMRNVPPLPANYWQRAGRAGRRHRMAVNLTYARPASHDRAYFPDPLKMLAGRVEPPRFNLRNELMVAKHVHATVLTRLHQLARPASGRTEAERTAITTALATAFPGG